MLLLLKLLTLLVSVTYATTKPRGFQAAYHEELSSKAGKPAVGQTQQESLVAKQPQPSSSPSKLKADTDEIFSGKRCITERHGFAAVTVFSATIFLSGLAVGVVLQKRRQHSSDSLTAFSPHETALSAAKSVAGALGTKEAAGIDGSAPVEDPVKGESAALPLEPSQPLASSISDQRAAQQGGLPGAAPAPGAAEACSSSGRASSASGEEGAEMGTQAKPQGAPGQALDGSVGEGFAAVSESTLGGSGRGVVLQGGDRGLQGVAEDDRADIRAAGALVGELTHSLQIDLQALSAGERVQLMHTVLHAWQAQQAKRHSEAMTR